MADQQPRERDGLRRGVVGGRSKPKSSTDTTPGEVPADLQRTVSGPKRSMPADLPPIDESTAVPAEDIATGRWRKPDPDSAPE